MYFLLVFSYSLNKAYLILIIVDLYFGISSNTLQLFQDFLNLVNGLLF